MCIDEPIATHGLLNLIRVFLYALVFVKDFKNPGLILAIARDWHEKR